MADAEWSHPTLTREQFLDRLSELSVESTIAEAEYAARGEDPPFWWLSFCDTDKPAGSQFLGACLIQAPTFVAATLRAHELQINPRGEVASMGPIPADGLSDEYRSAWTNRLLTKEEAESIPDPAESAK